MKELWDCWVQDAWRVVKSATGTGIGAKIPLLISEVHAWSRYISYCLNACPKIHDTKHVSMVPVSITNAQKISRLDTHYHQLVLSQHHCYSREGTPRLP